MSVVWNIYPNIGLGPLKFGMTHAEVAEFEDIMGPLDETTEQILPNGNIARNEFRDLGAPMCSFQDGVLRFLSISKSDIIDFRFQDVSVFGDDPKHVYSTLGRAAGAVYWHRSSVIIPALNMELAGFVMEYSDKGKPPVFVSRRAGFTWPGLHLFQAGYGLFKETDIIEISNEAT